MHAWIHACIGTTKDPHIEKILSPARRRARRRLDDYPLLRCLVPMPESPRRDEGHDGRERHVEKIVIPTAYFVRSEGLSGSSYGKRTTLALTTSTGGGGEPVVASADGAAAEAIVDEAAGEQQDKERHVDMLLLLAKCSFPALFVAVGGAVAIPANKGFLTESMRTATEEMAGGALLVTYAFELTKGYTLHTSAGGVSPSLVAWSFAGTLLSASVGPIFYSFLGLATIATAGWSMHGWHEVGLRMQRLWLGHSTVHSSVAPVVSYGAVL